MSNKVKVAIMDYGHGGSDPGAVSGKHTEKIYNLETGKAAKEELERNGWIVIETRRGDEYVSLTERCRIANNIAKKYPGAYIVFVSIHHNAGGGDRGETIYSIYEGEGKDVALKVADELRGINQFVKSYSKRGSDNKDYYYVIKNTSMPAIIVEVAFLDNASDVQICDTLEERKRNGIIIAHGILKASGASPISDNKFSESIAPGTKVKIIGTNYATGQSIPSWVKSNTYTVEKIRGDRALIKEITSWVYIRDLQLVSGGVTQTQKPIVVGDKVVITGTKYATGETIPSWARGPVYTVQQLGSNGALIKELVSWVRVEDLRRE